MSEVLIERKFYKDLLDRNLNSFRKGQGKNIALLGPRKSGKTTLLKYTVRAQNDLSSVYIDLEKISLNPENFSIEFIGNVLFNFLKKDVKEYRNFLDIHYLVSLKEHINEKAFELLKSTENELLKIKPDQKLLVENALNFPELLAADNNRKIIIGIDNFENILDLNNFSQIKDILLLINWNSENVKYAVASSAEKQMLHSLKDFETYEIKNLEKDEIFSLAKSILNLNDKECQKVSDEVFSLTNGHLYASALILKSYKNTKNVVKAFLVELLTKDSELYNHCKNAVDYYYNRARGQTLLKTILKVVANEELRLTDIARKIYRSAPVTKSILERLMEVDIISKKENKFCFNDKVLGLWLRFTSQGYDSDSIDDKILEELSREL